MRRFAIALAIAAVSAAAAAADCAVSAVPRGSFEAAVQRNAAAVVQVVVLRAARDPAQEGLAFEFFQPMQGLPLPGGEGVDRTFSSGFFIDAQGLLLASAHAVYDARETWVVTADGRHLRGTVVALDRQRDVALLKVDASGLPVVAAPVARPPCPGSWVVAIGSPFGFDRTVTAGIVSANPRYLHGSAVPLIQSDVVLNPGSSGGPLFDAEGALVGMNTMIYSATGIYVGMSFALPADEVMRIARALRNQGSVRGADIGVRAQPLTPALARAFGLDSTDGALVTRVVDGGPAQKAGLRAGDVILGAGRGERLDYAQVEARIGSAPPGGTLALDVWRDGALHAVRVHVAASAPEPLPPFAAPLRPARLGLALAVLKLAGLPPGIYVEGSAGSALLAGIERGDRIVAVNGSAVSTIEEFDAALEDAVRRGTIALLVARGATTAYVPVEP